MMISACEFIYWIHIKCFGAHCDSNTKENNAKLQGLLWNGVDIL